MHLVILVCSVLFLVIPTILSLFQLHREIKTKWLMSKNCREIIQPWILSYLTILYIISIISGSAFSAVEFCNSNLFRLRITYMNLPRRHKQLFRNKRIYSVVLLENVPQLVLQALFSVIMRALSAITLFSMIFSLISIILTIFEVSLKQHLFASENLVFIKFIVESPEIQAFGRNEFINIVEYQRFTIANEVAKVLSIDFSFIELLSMLFL